MGCVCVWIWGVGCLHAVCVWDIIFLRSWRIALSFCLRYARMHSKLTKKLDLIWFELSTGPTRVWNLLDFPFCWEIVFPHSPINVWSKQLCNKSWVYRHPASIPFGFVIELRIHTCHYFFFTWRSPILCLIWNNCASISFIKPSYLVWHWALSN